MSLLLAILENIWEKPETSQIKFQAIFRISHIKTLKNIA